MFPKLSLAAVAIAISLITPARAFDQKLKSNSSPASPPLSWQPTDARDLHSIWTR